ncbi:protein translocase subunit SecD [candidate division CSSED10-310 bacterium]|uniref:Multifunctional fusion protein n=1 Tax=candidate division CSSED10-310 bacterium TaxID=2855610 RepID=A0ABV6Z3U2_UNCC1
MKRNSELRELKSKIIALGLDLQGGMHMVLQVQTDEAVTAELLRLKSDILELFKADKEISVKSSQITTIEDEVALTFTDHAVAEEARKKILADLGELKFRTKAVDEGKQLLFFSFNEGYITNIKDRTFQQALETIRNRIDEFGVSEPTIQRQGLTGSRILIQLPGIEDIERAKSIIGRTAQLKFQMVKDYAPTKEELLAAYDGNVPDEFVVIRGGGRGERGRWFYLLEKEAKITGSDLESAFVGTDEYGLPGVDFVLKGAGATKFRRLTSRNIGRDLAIVLDGQVQSAPRIQSTIGKRGQITGNFSAEEAQDLSLVLRAGALPASVIYLEERTVGPSLGKDSVRKGVLSALVGMVIVLIFMVFYYRLSGIIADVALIMNILILTAAMAGLGATLTLPGIAGIILTIGMAVDANVLIFERIREELKHGKTVRTSIAGGFSKAMLTIVDANVTTIIAAFVLLHFGSGPLRGFAVTLSIGIVASMFSALFVSRVVFDMIQQRFQLKELKFQRLFEKPNFDFVGKRFICIIVSLAVIGVGGISMVVRGGLNYGIDFAGGTLVQVKFNQPLKIEEVRGALKKIKLGDSIIQKYGSESEVLIRTIRKATDIQEFQEKLWKKINIPDYKSVYNVVIRGSNQLLIETRNDESFKILQDTVAQLPFSDITTTVEGLSLTVSFIEISKEISDTLKATFSDNPFEIQRVEMVGPQVGKELRKAAIVAIAMALVGIVIYITLRFEFRFAIAAILALIHDVLITVGLFSLGNKEFNLPIVAALLTIVGYSLNDTIVVFDRLRENYRLYRKEGLLILINNTINQTLSRTLLTSLTTLFVVLCLFIFGGEVINDFAFALLIGIVVGTYSSMYIASPFLIVWEKYSSARDKKRSPGRRKY